MPANVNLQLFLGMAIHELADNLRAVLGCVVEDGEWAAGVAIAGQAAPGAGAEPAPS